MEVVVRGKNVEIPERLRVTAREKVAKLTRFAHDIGRVEVDFSEVKNPRVAANQCCEVTVHLKRAFLKAHAQAPEALAALDLTIDKVEHQVSRLKDKRISRSHPRRRRLVAGGPPTDDDPAWATLADGPGEPGVDAADGDEAFLVRTKRFDMKPMPPEEAALQMDLLGHTFFLFVNSENGRAGVVYRRHDGHLGLIEAG